MSVLCLDIATQTGFAVWDSDFRRPHSGSISVKSELPGNGYRLLKFWKLLRMLGSEYDIDHVFFEYPGGNLKGNAARVLLALIGVLELWAALQDIPVESVAPTELKKFAVGRGQGVDKDEMVAAAQREWPRQIIKDHNEADALLILAYAMKQYEYVGGQNAQKSTGTKLSGSRETPD